MAGLPWSRRSQQPWLPPSVAPRCFFSQGTGTGDNSISPLGATFRQGSRELFLPCAQEPHGRARPSLHRRRPLGTRDPLPLYPIPSPTPHFSSDLWHTAAAAMASIFFSTQRRRSKRQQPRTPSVSLACHPLDVLRSHIVAARCPTTRSPSIFPRWRSSPAVSA